MKKLTFVLLTIVLAGLMFLPIYVEIWYRSDARDVIINQENGDIWKVIVMPLLNGSGMLLCIVAIIAFFAPAISYIGVLFSRNKLIRSLSLIWLLISFCMVAWISIKLFDYRPSATHSKDILISGYMFFLLWLILFLFTFRVSIIEFKNKKNAIFKTPKAML